MINFLISAKGVNWATVSVLAVMLSALPVSVAIAQDVTAQVATAQGTPEMDETVSDVLIVIDSDGRSHTVQHTIATNGPLLKLRLPGSVVPHQAMFFGPERVQFAAQHKNSPSILEISSGSAFVRYQHQYGDEVQQVQAGYFVLTTPSVPASVETSAESLTHSSITHSNITHSSISWVFPNEFEVVSYSVTDQNTGRWVSINNTLTFYNAGNDEVALSINYKKTAGTLTLDTPLCNDTNTPTDACADDLDEDGVPDYRDICTSELGQDISVFGCQSDQTILLDNIDFATGRTYLDASARQSLDKVAFAILKSEHTFFEIGSHTDNDGAATSNQQLSEKRAEAVRHYLMLKGVDPNALRAAGYGEKYPIRDNLSPDGRRANRRIELVVLQ